MIGSGQRRDAGPATGEASAPPVEPGAGSPPDRPGESTRDYWLHRERAARALAAQAADPGIARIHLELAALYASRAAADRAAQPPRADS